MKNPTFSGYWEHEALGGGYTLDNGITVCAPCHELAEVFHRTRTAYPGYAPEDLLAIIGVRPGRST